MFISKDERNLLSFDLFYLFNQNVQEEYIAFFIIQNKYISLWHREFIKLYFNNIFY